MKNVFENRLNVLLSELLNEMGLFSSSEHIGIGGREDIIANYHGLRIVLEGSYSKSDAEKDATKRIDQFPIDLAIAIHYSEKYPQGLSEIEIKKNLKKANFYVKVIVPIDISNTILEYLYEKKYIPEAQEGWNQVNLSSLSNLIRESAQFIISEQHIKQIEEEVEQFIQLFINLLRTHPNSENLAKKLYDIFFQLYGFSIGKIEDIKEVIFAQAGLALLLSTIYYESIRYKYGFKSVEILLKDKGVISALQRSVEKILDINYEPIFKTTQAILTNLPPTDNRVYKLLVDLSIKIVSKRSLLRKDLAGRIYHKIVGEKSLQKGLATFYTQIPSAYLLLYLSNPIIKIQRDNEKIEFILPRVCDFACGSGTLLTASYSAFRTNLFLSLMRMGIDIEPKEINEKFHRDFMDICYGIDVLKYATQITALNLAFHNPEIELDHFNTYSIPLGLKKETESSISLGSLEYIRLERGSIKFFTGEKATQVGITGEEEKYFTPRPFDLIVMNPPFTRATGRGGKKGGGLFGFMIDDNLRTLFLKEYKDLRDIIRKELINIAKEFLKGNRLLQLLELKDFKPFTAIGPAGEGLLFLYLANKWIKTGGKISFVLPKNLLMASSWFLARTLLLSNYHLEYIVISFDSEEGYNFSESTSLSECLFVAKRVKKHKENESTKFIMLLKKPKTSIEAISLANQIEKIEEDGYIEISDCSAFIVIIERTLLIENLNNWGRFIFLPNFQLLEDLTYLLKGNIRFGKINYKIPFIKLNELITSIGIDAHQFSDNFKKTSKKVPGSIEALIGGEEKNRERMFISPNANVLPIKRGKEIFNEKKGKLLIPDRIWLETAHVISLVSEKPILSNIFYALNLRDEKPEKLKALCLWFNTTWGILLTLADRQETRGAWIRIKMTQWRLVLVLNINYLSEIQLQSLSDVFDKFKDLDLGRIPQQYNNESDTYKLRRELDKSFLKALQIDVKDKDLDSLYQEINSSLKQWIG